MQKHLLFTFAILSFILTAYAEDDTAQYKLNVHDFNELEVVDGVTVEYFCRSDSAGWAMFVCEPDMASHIMFTNEKNKLTVRTDADERPLAGVPKIKVYSTSLIKVTNSGDSILSINLDDAIPMKEFKARQIGNGTTEIHALNCENLDAGTAAGKGSVVIAGKARKVKINNVGTGPIDAKALEAGNISCFLFGTGNIECNPAEHLRVYGAGSGKVIYHGSPKVTMRGLGVKAVAYSEDLSFTLYGRKRQ